MSYRKRLEQLINEGNVLLNPAPGPSVLPPPVNNWVAEACQLLILVLGQDSPLSQIATEALQKVRNQKIEKRDEVINEVTDLMKRALEEDLLKPVFKSEDLDDHLRLKIIDKVFKSWWVRLQMALVLVTVVFLISGIIKISSFELNFDKTVQDSRNDVRNTADQILNEINTKRSEFETAIANSRADAQEVLTSLSDIKHTADLLESKLRERLNEDRTTVLASLSQSLEVSWKSALDNVVENQRKTIVDAAEKRANDLSHEVAPQALTELGSIRENYGNVKAKHDELLRQATEVAQQLGITAAQAKSFSDNFENKSSELTHKQNAVFEALSKDIGALRTDFETLKASDTNSGAFYWLVSAAIFSFLAFILASVALFKSISH